MQLLQLRGCTDSNGFTDKPKQQNKNINSVCATEKKKRENYVKKKRFSFCCCHAAIEEDEFFCFVPPKKNLKKKQMMLHPAPDPVATQPLWKWLLNPKTRLHLHESRKVPGPDPSSSSSHPNPNNKQNPIDNHDHREAALWRWRLKMQSIILNGTPVERRNTEAMRASFFTNNSLHGRDEYLFGVQRHPADVASAVVGTRKPDTRFAAKTAAPSLISEIQTRTMALMSMNLTPVTRSAVGSSRFDMLPGSRSAAHEALQRSVHKIEHHQNNSGTIISSTLQSLAVELRQWKRCIASMMKTTESSSKPPLTRSGVHLPVSSSAAAAQQDKEGATTKNVVVTEASFRELGARIGQLCCLEDTPDDAGVIKSFKEFANVAERDWALLVAHGKCSQRSSTVAVADVNASVGMSLQLWITGVLLPTALILAPAAASSTEETLVAHAVEFVSALRNILFPQLQQSSSSSAISPTSTKNKHGAHYTTGKKFFLGGVRRVLLLGQILSAWR